MPQNNIHLDRQHPSSLISHYRAIGPAAIVAALIFQPRKNGRIKNTIHAKAA